MTMIEGESEKEVKQGKNNHLGDEIEIDLMDILGLFLNTHFRKPRL